MPDPGPILLGVLIPFLAAGAVLLLRARLAARRGTAFQPGSFEGLALGLGYAAGHTVPAGRPTLPPLDSTDWLFWLALAAAAVSLGTAFRPAPARWTLIPRIALSVAVPFLVLKPLRGPEGLGILAAIGWPAAALVWGAALDRLAIRRPGASLPIVLGLVSGATAIALSLSGTLRLGQYAGSLAGALAAVLLLSRTARPLSLAGGGLLAAAAVLPGLWLAGAANEMPISAAILLALAPLAAWVAEVGPLKRRKPWLAALAGLAAVALLLAGAVAIAWMASPPFE